ncbi:IS200/IS605 family element transposase accessory protein TnpB [Deferribacter autotrophicus]|uniref:IS200/IS605 family element transposase accessory protein TnpB n=1 Tax=Deferribacter autotrophicus TaxID=500465 RepID=A0A5A8F108_9BACT|nr:RNA-guided endonuclease TnpB family protein [Deferribacter autotrophicus]KAA0257551.1 IS200/IS605 family element transposase accessory protein TnpB [Deferribacter autotrophicus]
MQLAHKIRLDPNNKQITYFKKACGVARFVWNWALENWEKQYKTGKKPNALELKKQFNSIKRKEYPFVLEVTKYASQQPFLQLQEAFGRYFKGLARKPRFKKKKSNKDSFYIGGDQIKVHDNKVRIPKLGWVRMRENLRFNGKILNATVSCKAGKWFISFTIDVVQNPYQPCENQAEVGVDLGIEKLAVLSDGTFFENIKTLNRYEKRLKRLQRQLSRKQKGSNRYKKQVVRIEKLYYRIRNIRSDYLHKITTYLTKNYKTIVIEDLNVKGLLKNHHLAKAISDVGFHELKRQLEYKTQLRGNNLIIVNRWFPSSKICSKCGYVNYNLKLSDRTFKCPNCGLVINRDLNAAINLLNYGRVSSTRTYTPVERGSVDDRSLVLPKKHPLAEAGTQQNLTMVRFE